MSEQFTIERVGEPREWSSKRGGKFLSYPLDLKDANGHLHMGVESNRKLKGDGSHSEPKLGDVVMGDIGPDRNGNDKLTLDYDAMKEMGGGREVSSSGSSDYRRNGKSPDQQASIVRQHSQQVALEFLTGTGALASGKSVPPVDHLNLVVKPVIDWFEADANNASKTASGPEDGGGPLKTANLPTASGPSQPPDDTHQSLSHFLEAAGENSVAANLIANWHLSADPVDGALSETEMDAALSALQDDSKRERAAQRLRERYVKANGEVPEAEPVDDIPFARPEYRAPFGERLRWRR